MLLRIEKLVEIYVFGNGDHPLTWLILMLLQLDNSENYIVEEKLQNIVNLICRRCRTYCA